MIPFVYLHASSGVGSDTRLSDSFLSVFSRRATSFMKVVAISRKPESGSLSVTQLIPDSEQIDRYDFGPVLISMRVSVLRQQGTHRDTPSWTDKVLACGPRRSQAPKSVTYELITRDCPFSRYTAWSVDHTTSRTAIL